MSLAQEIGEFLMAVGLSKYFKIQRNGYKLRFYPTSISLRLWQSRLRGRRVLEEDENLLRKILKPGDIVFDIGANVGMLTLTAAATTGPTGRVYSFEPHPKVCGYLQGNVELNGFENVEVQNLGLGNENGTCYFTDMDQDDRNQIRPENQDGKRIPVEVKTLDDVTADVDPIDLLKVDVEGYEKYVFQGGQKTLAKSRMVYYESCEKNYQDFGYSGDEVDHMIRTAGFTIYSIRDEHTLSPFPEQPAERKTQNLLALKDPDAFIQQTGMKIR